MVNPIQKAQDILDFKGETVDSAYLKEVIRELLVHIALYPTSKVIRDLEEENEKLRADVRRLLESIALSATEVCK